MMSLLSVSALLKGAVIGQEVSDYRCGLQKNPVEELQLMSELHLCGLLRPKI